MLLLLSGLLFAQVEDETAYDTTVIDTEVPVAGDYDDENTTVQADVSDAEQSEYGYFQSKWNYVDQWDSLKMRKLPDSIVAAMHADEDFWYANHVFAKKEAQNKAKQSSGRERSGFLNILLWFLIIGGFVAFLAIYLVNSNVGLFRMSKKIKEGHWDEDFEDIFSINYTKEIEAAIRAGNHRLAVRLMFLRLLRNLSDRKVIQYKQDRTNFDYLMQLSNTTWYSPFMRLARHYEYVWYGKFNIDEKQFEIIQNEFGNIERHQ